jgi:hypothetical protein
LANSPRNTDKANGKATANITKKHIRTERY